MTKAVVYAASKEIYHMVKPALNSLLWNGNIDRVYILAEDERLGFTIPDCVDIINVSDQTFFRKDGPNYKSRWTYMSLMKAALPKLFPEFDRILWLDVDTMVAQDISDLWKIRMDDYYVAGAREIIQSNVFGYTYVNVGVLMMNLRKLREYGKDDELICALNNRKFDYPDQDCINEYCIGKVYELPNDYNINLYTGIRGNVKIRHFAGEKWDWFNLDREFQKYKE